MIERNVAQFSAELAGQQVGWVNIGTTQPQDESARTQVDVVIAHVGDEGAGVTARTFEDGADPSITATGFVLASCFSTAFRHDIQSPSGDPIFHSDGPNHSGSTISADHIVATGIHHKNGAGGEAVVWFENTAGLLPHIKRELGEVGLVETAYPYVYFGLAHTMGHQEFAPKSPTKPEIDLAGRLLADPAMSADTQAELAATEAVSTRLVAQIDINERAKKVVTAHGDAQDVRAVRKLSALRRSIDAHERRAIEVANSMVMGSVSFAPRAETDLRVSIEEHKALRSGNPAPVIAELGREHTELLTRASRATGAAVVLSTLGLAEIRAIEATST